MYPVLPELLLSSRLFNATPLFTVPAWQLVQSPSPGAPLYEAGGPDE